MKRQEPAFPLSFTSHLKLWLLLGIGLLQLHSAKSQFSPGLVALKDVQVIDVQNGKLLEHYTVLIRGSRIDAIGPINSIPIPDSAMQISCTGQYLIPGLIDAHVHLLSDVSGTDTRAHAEKDSRAMLLSGITSVRDMAGDGRALSSLTRDALLNEIISPDIYYAALFAGPGFFKDPRTHQASAGGVPGQMFYMRAVTDSTDLPIAVAESKGTGATAIKLYAQISGSLARKLTTAAHQQGLKVWSHFELTQSSPIETVSAGVDVVSHASMIAKWRPDRKDSIPLEWRSGERDSVFWNSQFAQLPVKGYVEAMKKNKTILDATLLIEKEFMNNPALSPYARAAYTARYEIGRRFTKLALDNGIPVCTGTDVDENRFVQREMKVLVTDAGFTPLQAIRAATLHGAMAIGIEKHTGSIEKGKDADLVLLSANPLQNINHIDQVKLVIKKGRLYNSR